MKKIALVLVALMFAAPAWADVDITCEQVGDTNEILVSFDASSEEPSLIRAFGLNIQLDNDANILEVDDTINADYYIFPGTIQIDASTGEVTSYGTAVGEVIDSPDTLPGLNSNSVTVEMASLYAPTGGISSPNSPDSSGPLFSFKVNKDTCITISGNVARAGSNGVVMEDPDEDPTVVFGTCCMVIPTGPACWNYPCHQYGDYNGDGLITAIDVQSLVWAWQWGYNECADFNHDGFITAIDVGILVNQWGKPCP